LDSVESEELDVVGNVLPACDNNTHSREPAHTITVTDATQFLKIHITGRLHDDLTTGVVVSQVAPAISAIRRTSSAITRHSGALHCGKMKPPAATPLKFAIAKYVVDRIGATSGDHVCATGG
jgi:hypothetical protein